MELLLVLRLLVITVVDGFLVIHRHNAWPPNFISVVARKSSLIPEFVCRLSDFLSSGHRMLSGVIDDTRRNKDDHFCRLFLLNLLPEKPSNQWHAAKYWHTTNAINQLVLHQSTNHNRFTIFNIDGGRNLSTIDQRERIINRRI